MTASATAVPRNATELVELIGNLFGIDYGDNPDVPVWKRRAVEAGKINAALKRNKSLTLERLALAARHCAETGVEITAPYGVIYHVDAAVAAAAQAKRAGKQLERDLVDRVLETAVEDALVAERRRMAACPCGNGRCSACQESGAWIGRLTRSVGSARTDAVQEWQRSNR